MNATTENYQAVVDLPIGPVGISMRQGRLTGVEYLDSADATFRRDVPGLAHVLAQIERYFEDACSDLALDLELEGSPFQRRVWQALRAIPAGRTLTYGELAVRIGSGARAVGNACRANPCPLVVPCHRVVAARGLGGFAGERSGRKLEIKRWLLHHEGWL
ncbi:MAG: methylated-DNA--[protein]-cysteine S-methyltransferase [Candidatus Thiodiazotropha sp.]